MIFHELHFNHYLYIEAKIARIFANRYFSDFLFDNTDMALLFEELSYLIRGMFFKTYNELGPGFKEEVYARALLKLLKDNNISYEREKQFSIKFNNETVGSTKIDLVIDNKIIIEVKATEINNNLFEKQILSYLKNTGVKLGFLVNFGMNKLYIRRYVNSKR